MIKDQYIGVSQMLSSLFHIEHMRGEINNYLMRETNTRRSSRHTLLILPGVGEARIEVAVRVEDRGGAHHVVAEVLEGLGDRQRVHHLQRIGLLAIRVDETDAESHHFLAQVHFNAS